MESLEELKQFYNGKIVLVTGHTGFKGSWLTEILSLLGAKVIGYSLKPNTESNLFDLLNNDDVISIFNDVRNLHDLKNVFHKYNPEIVFHLAAQPIVRESYKDPVYTYETNVIGTVNICECVRQSSSVKSFVNITTDKVYLNDDVPNHPFKEDESLDGFDPYSNSKSCSELVTHSYYKSFIEEKGIAVSTARAGNVIGGGDFSVDRIIPDCYRAIKTNNVLQIRNPKSTRPYQHVLEPLYAYLLIAMKQYDNQSLCGAYNIGPDKCECVSTLDLVNFYSRYDQNLKYEIHYDNGPHEASFLMLDNNKVKSLIGWNPKLHIDDAIRFTANWYKAYLENKDIKQYTIKQIEEYFNL